MSNKGELHQAGGGVSGEDSSFAKLNAPLVKKLNNLYASHAGDVGKTWSHEQSSAFFKQTQGEPEGAPHTEALLKQKDVEFKDFLTYLTSPASNVVAPLDETDLSWPLSSYFISSSHNTYLTGNQLYSESSTDAYRDVLLRGGRCIEVDVWNGDESDAEESSDSDSDDDPEKYAKRKDRVDKVKGKIPKSLTSRFKDTSLGRRLGNFVDRKTEPKKSPTSPPPASAAPGQPGDQDVASLQKLPSPEVGVVEPKVYHGYTLTKDVPFRDVCYAIREHAFTASDLPVIVSLEVHCGPQQQQCMVDIMEQAFKGYLVPQPPEDTKELAPPGTLRNKILIKVKYAPPDKDVSPGGDADEEDDSLPPEAAAKRKKKPPPKIIQELSRLGIFTRGVSFKSLMQPEATMPTHIFSLSEKAVLDVHEKQAQALFDHNKHFLMRTYPHGFRIGSSNLDPVVFWRKGIQVVALNWQNWDEGMMLNEGMFAGTGGYVLKPDGYRGNKTSSASDPTKGQTQATAVKHHKLDLTVEVFLAQEIPLPSVNDKASSFRPYVKCELHVEEPGERHGGGAVAAQEDGKEKEGEYKARTKTRKGVDPDFEGEALRFAAIPGVVEELSFVRFTVRDDEFGRDDLAAWACVRLDRLRVGYRFVRLMDSKGMETPGLVLVKISKRLF